MTSFRRLMTVVLITGTTAGLLLFVLQFLTMRPLIQQAEVYEQAAEAHASHDASHEAEWEPSEGVERIGYTVLGTILTGIAFSALLFGVASLLDLELDVRRGVWLGLAGFACCVLAPALGLPPKPPGVAGAEVHAAQIWWAATVAATAVGLWALTCAPKTWTWRGVGLLCLLAPHLLGAPPSLGPSEVPPDLNRHFALLSIATRAVFWLTLGSIGSYFYARRVDGSTLLDPVEPAH